MTAAESNLQLAAVGRIERADLAIVVAWRVTYLMRKCQS